MKHHAETRETELTYCLLSVGVFEKLVFFFNQTQKKRKEFFSFTIQFFE